MYDLKKIQTVASASIATLPLARPVGKAKRRHQPAINVRNPRLLMGLIFLFLLLAYLVAYAQDVPASPRPYLVIDPSATSLAAPAEMSGLSAAQPEQPLLIPATGR